MTIHATVNLYRHGTSISDQACSKKSLILVANQSAGRAESTNHFYQFLAGHRESRNRIHAVFTGRLVRGTEKGFVVKRDFDFELDTVSSVSEGGWVIRP